MGWVSILNPDRIASILAVPSHWHLVAYLCIGYPEKDSPIPELEQARWESRQPTVTILER
jgi:5,6-dimethylbenzimidazole synthase